MHILSFGYHLFNFNLLFEKKRTNEDTERGLGVHCLLSCLFCLPPILMYLGLAMRKEGGQHHKYISYSYITCMCCFEHMNWSGKIEFSQGKIRELCFAIFVGTLVFCGCILRYCSFLSVIFKQWSFKHARRLLKTYWYSEFFASDLVTVTNAALGPENAVHGNLFAYRLFRLRRSTFA